MMQQPKMVKVQKENEVNTYAHLWHASWVFMHIAETKIEGSYYQIMAGILFAALALEAFCNHVGKFLFPCWESIEKKLGPQEKLCLICEKLGIAKDDGKRPFQTVSELIKFRNSISHGKSVKLRKDFEVPRDGLESFLQKELEAEWQAYIQIENLKRVREDVEAIITSIHARSKMEDIAFNLGISGYVAG
jgi:hypothetical protein